MLSTLRYLRLLVRNGIGGVGSVERGNGDNQRVYRMTLVAWVAGDVFRDRRVVAILDHIEESCSRYICSRCVVERV